MVYTQIYSIQSVDEARMCIEAGADRIGVLSQEPGGAYPCGVKREDVKKIFDFIGDKAIKVLISVKPDEEKILQETEYLRPDVLHLCAEYEGNEAFKKKLEERVPGVQLMEAVAVQDESAIEDAIRKSKYADLLILDSKLNTIPGIGATGITHDWDIDRRIVERVEVPVIIAGGLGCDNVIEAIEKVHPYAVDSLTKTSIKKDGVLIGKDEALTRKFCALVQAYNREEK